MVKKDIKTPRDFCSSQGRKFLFGQRRDDSKPAWRKIGYGLIAVCDGSKRHYVLSHMVFGVEIDDNNTPQIFTYWRDGETPTERLMMNRPYSIKTVVKFNATSELKRSVKPISYSEMVDRVTKLYPDIYVPTVKEFAMTYGLKEGEL